jgi:hypothetical protein
MTARNELTPPNQGPKANAPCDSPVMPCAAKKSIVGKFTEASAKCGDAANVEADGVLISEGAATSFSITRVRDGLNVDTVNAPMGGLKVRLAKWKLKRPAGHLKNDTFTFEVSADGASSKSSNQFIFSEIPDQASETKTIACTSGVFGWTGKFDIKYLNDTVYVTVKIKLQNRSGPKPESGGANPAIGDPVTDADKLAMRTDVEGKLSSKVKLIRTACGFGAACTCEKPIKIAVEFVESGEHHLVNLFQGAGRANATNWTRVKTRENSWAHETGHLLGFYDEYTGGATGVAPRWLANEPANVMNVGLTVPPNYGWDFRDWMTAKTGESWTAK